MAGSLQSERIKLRRLTTDDAIHFARLLGDDSKSVQMMGTMPDPCTEATARRWIEKRIKPGGHIFAIIRVSDGRFMGAVGFGDSSEKPALGYWIGRQYWGFGYATEAVRMIVGLACSMGIRRMEAVTFPHNPASSRVLEKSGFKNIGATVEDLPLRGGLRKVHQYVLDILVIKTPNLTLIPSELRHLENSLTNRDALASLLGVKIPDSYPVEADAVPWFCELLRNDPSLAGWLHFMVMHSGSRTLVGDGGFKGKPGHTGVAGLVEIGYSIVQEFRGLGYATEVARGLIGYAFSHAEVTAVAAHTRVDNIGSIKVLEHSGMKILGEVEDPNDGPMLQWRLDRDEYCG